jgi:hypothetical protein
MMLRLRYGAHLLYGVHGHHLCGQASVSASIGVHVV